MGDCGGVPANSQQVPVESVCARMGVSLGQIELASLEGRPIDGRRQYVCDIGIRHACELREELAAAGPNRSLQLFAVIGEIEKGRGRGELLALEEHRG